MSQIARLILLDDALSRLAPSLQKHNGCTIIDINPGIGLWSSKIHDIIKPRRHILAEPRSSPFVPHLESLIKEKDSRYHIVDWSSVDAWRPDRYVAEGLLPAFATQTSKEPNTSILVLANLAAPSPKSITMNKSHIKLLDWASDISYGCNFHAGGPVRMLLWCPETETTPILPRTIRYRTKLSLTLEMMCHIEKIVGSVTPATKRLRKRDQTVELESGKHVAKVMEKAGVTVPLGRETEIHEQIQAALAQGESKDEAPTASIRARSWHKELEDLRERFKDVDIPRNKTGKRIIMERIPSEIVGSPEFARLLELERNLKHVQKRTGVIEELLQEQAKIDSLDIQAHNSPPDTQAAAQAEIQDRKEKLQKRLGNLRGHHIRDEYEFFKHDRKAYAQDPPLLMWDHRSADPLKSHEEEFYPAKAMSLLDIQPRHPLPYSMTGAQQTFFPLLAKTLWHNGRDNLKILDQIAPGAFDAVTSRVPSLRDPTRGGERDLRDLPIRRLTPEMVYGIITAWFDWPFRPDLADLIHRGNIAEEGEDGSAMAKGY
ncbi:MAG: hypothetical protein Q9166_007043 [cf. Caloplaca sp. 2 TL-2023]